MSTLEEILKELKISTKDLDNDEKLYSKIVTKLEDPKQGFSKFSLMLDLIHQMRQGKSFFRITIPCIFVSPLSMLELVSLYMTPYDGMEKIASVKTPLERFLGVVKWSMVNMPRMIHENGFCHIKPFNPILGEKHVWKWKSKGGSKWFGMAEQVSHHPPMSSFYISSRENNVSIRSTIGTKSKLYPNSFSFQMIGEINFRIHTTKEEYELSFPPICVYGILFGRQFSEYNDSYKMRCLQTGFHYELKFKAKCKNKISGSIWKEEKKNGKILKKPIYDIQGIANKKIFFKDVQKKKEILFVDNTDNSFFKVKQIVQPIKDQMGNESRRNWHLVSKELKRGDLQKAHKFKDLIENRQRAYRKERNDKKIIWKPKDFVLMKEIKNDTPKIVQLHNSIFENTQTFKKGEKDPFETHEMFQKF